VSGSVTSLKPCLLAIHDKLQKIVASKLLLDGSPEQISGWLKTQYPKDESLRVSRETIYRRLFIQAREPGAEWTLTVSSGSPAKRISQEKPQFHYFLLLCAAARVRAGALLFNLS
jgi:IS30 family transposase